MKNKLLPLLGVIALSLFSCTNFLNAAIIYTDIVDQTLTPQGTIDINMDGNGGSEFSFMDMGFGGIEPGIFFNSQNEHLTTVSNAEWDVLNGINFGTTINANAGFFDQGDAYINPMWGTTQFPSGSDTYLGAQFNLGANTHFGWILVNWNAATTTFIVKGFAYEDVPNVSISAGDMGSPTILVTSITVSGQGGATAITTQGGTLQMLETVLPGNATDPTVTWSVVPGTGQATINGAGLLTAVANGTVTVIATANDGSGITGTVIITISNQSPVVLVTSITVQGQGGTTTITTQGGTLQMLETVLPGNATDPTVTWSVVPGTGQATINGTGVLTAVANGTVTVVATANDGSGITGTVIITISNQNPVVPVTNITVQGQGGVTTIAPGSTLQMLATVLPANADDLTFTWGVINGTGNATIDANGMLTAVSNGDVAVIATANDGSGAIGQAIIVIENNAGVEVLQATSIILYPNPANDFITLQNNFYENGSLFIYNHQGKLILSESFDQFETTLNIGHVPVGMYYYQVKFENGATISNKFIKR